MNWDKLVFLLTVMLIGYLPYKVPQRLNPNGLTHISTIHSATLAFIFILLSTLLITQTKVFINMSPLNLVIIFLTTLAWFSAPKLIRKVGTFPKELISQKSTWFVVRFEPRTFYLKFTEILFQQAKFLYLLYAVFSDLSLISKIIWFTLIIGLLHFTNLFFLSRREALIFTFLSFPMAIVFSYLILRGLVLVTLSIHLWFYLIWAGYPWLNKK